MSATAPSARPAAGVLPPAWRSRLGGPAGAALIAIGLTVLMAAPVLRSPTTLLFGREIVGRHPAPFIVISQFQSPPRLSPYTQPITDLLGTGLARLLGDGVAAVNILVLLSFPLATLFAWLLAFELTRSRTAAWIAGLVYAFAPFHLAQSAYHPHGSQIQWLPLYLLALWRCAERGTGRRIALLVLATPLVLLSNFYYGLMAVVLTPVVLLGRWLAGPPVGRRPRAAGMRSTLLLLGGLAVLGLGFVAAWAPTALDDPAALAWPREDLTQYSASWWSYLVPPVGHPLFDGAVEAFWTSYPTDALLEQQLTLGFGLLLLAGLAGWLRLRGDRRHGLDRAPELILLLAAAFLCSLSPDWRVEQWTLPRPSGLLYELLPMFRAYARFGVVVLLAAAILAGSAASSLMRRSRRHTLAALTLLLLVAVELAPFPPWRRRDVLPTSAHRWFSGRAAARVLDCGSPTDTALRFATAHFDGALAFLVGNEDCGDPGLPADLAARGITHLIVRPDTTLEAWLDRTGPPSGLAPFQGFEDARVLAVEAAGDSPRLTFAGGFHWREYSDSGTYRWIERDGRLAIVHDGPGAVEVTLELTLNAFPGPRQVEARFDGQPIGRLTVGTEPAPHRLGPLVVTPGRHLLSLKPLSPPTVADEVLGNGDGRAVSVALWEWSWRESA